MNDIDNLARNIVYVAWDLDRTVFAKNGVEAPLRSALTSKRFVRALLECTYRGLSIAFSRPSASDVEPIANFATPILLKVDAVIEDAAAGQAIQIPDLERAAGRLAELAPDVRVDDQLVEAVVRFAAEYAARPEVAEEPGRSPQ